MVKVPLSWSPRLCFLLVLFLLNLPVLSVQLFPPECLQPIAAGGVVLFPCLSSRTKNFCSEWKSSIASFTFFTLYLFTSYVYYGKFFCPKRIPLFYKENTDMTSNASFDFTLRISCSLPVIQHMLAKSLRANRVSLWNRRGLAGHSAKRDTRSRIKNTMTRFARVIACSAG